MPADGVVGGRAGQAHLRWSYGGQARPDVHRFTRAADRRRSAAVARRQTRSSSLSISADWKSNRRVAHIFRINADGTGQVQLTFGDRGESSPRWSPDGKSIAFTTRRDDDSNNQIYLLSVEGGEARRLTNHPTAPGSLTWSPDGKSIYFVAADAKSTDEKEKRARSATTSYTFEENNFKQRHLWTTDLDGKTKRSHRRRLLASPTTTCQRRRQRIAMTARADARCSRFSDRTEVWVMDADGTQRPAADEERRARRRTRRSRRTARRCCSSSGSNAAFETYYNDKLFVVPAAGGPRACVTPPTCRIDVERAAWSQGRQVASTSSPTWASTTSSSWSTWRPASRRQITNGKHALGGWAFAEANGAARVHAQHCERPGEVYTLRRRRRRNRSA